MSIDSFNAAPDDNSNLRGNFNYIDTYIEYFAEVILKYDNAIPESGKNAPKHWQQHKLCEITWGNISAACNNALFYIEIKKLFFNRDRAYTYLLIKEISPPPKQFCCRPNPYRLNI